MKNPDTIKLSIVFLLKTRSYIIPKHAIYMLWINDFEAPSSVSFDLFTRTLIGTGVVTPWLAHDDDNSLGSICINFDERCIVDNNRFGNPLRMPANWVMDSLFNHDSDVNHGLDASIIRSLACKNALTVAPRLSGQGLFESIHGPDHLEQILEILSGRGSVERHWVCLRLSPSWSVIS